MMKNINKLISQAIMDDEFRTRLLKNPMDVGKEFNLTEEELAELQKIDFTELTAIDNQLEERISKTFINLPEFSDEGDYHSSHGAHGSHNNESTHNNGGGAW